MQIPTDLIEFKTTLMCFFSFQKRCYVRVKFNNIVEFSCFVKKKFSIKDTVFVYGTVDFSLAMVCTA
jgi:hypothetical protein